MALKIQNESAVLRNLMKHPALLFHVNPTPQMATHLARLFHCSLYRAQRECFCNDCKRIERNCHPDVLRVQCDTDGMIKIETIREACLEMQVGPIEREMKLLLIEHADKMTLAAANAFLKTLEESNVHLRFWLFCDNPLSLPPTIVSRCVRQKIELQSDIVAPKHFAEILAQSEQTQEIDKLLSGISSREEALDFLTYCQEQLRGTVSDEFFKDNPKRYRLYHLLDLSFECESRLRSNANYSLMLESWLWSLRSV